MACVLRCVNWPGELLDVYAMKIGCLPLSLYPNREPKVWGCFIHYIYAYVTFLSIPDMSGLFPTFNNMLAFACGCGWWQNYLISVTWLPISWSLPLSFSHLATRQTSVTTRVIHCDSGSPWRRESEALGLLTCDLLLCCYCQSWLANEVGALKTTTGHHEPNDSLMYHMAVFTIGRWLSSSRTLYEPSPGDEPPSVATERDPSD